MPKSQRIGLLVELWKNSILSKEKAIITVAAAQFENPNSAQRLQQMVQDDKIFANFIADLKQNSIDPIEHYTDVDTDYARVEGFTKSVFKCFDLIPHLHADTRFSVITESHVDAPTNHTEKVWKAIFNSYGKNGTSIKWNGEKFRLSIGIDERDLLWAVISSNGKE